MSVTFPDTDTYLVNWTGGSSGAFILSLLYSFLYSKVNENHISDSGNAHEVAFEIITNNWKNPAFRRTNFRLNQIKIYDVIDPLDETKPLILYNHVPPNLEKLFAKYPKCKHIRISVCDKMLPRTQGNLFYKTTYEHYDVSQLRWDRMVFQHSYLNGYTPQNCPQELIRRYIEDTCKIWPAMASDNYYTEYYEIPLDFRDRVITVPYYDIIYNRDKILDLLATLTDKPIRQDIVDFYDIYLAKQKWLMQEKMPWINDQ